ncbi:MAG TPA: hypothetical protein VD861_01000, partial [Pyrinomonadaceae bacterium]|nr:hypothetical protein [Pyrinomonadaceae bacterium]
SFQDKREEEEEDPYKKYGVYSDPLFAGNNFTRREHGGGFAAGETLLVGERRPEVVRFNRPGYVHRSVDDFNSHEQSERRRMRAARLRQAGRASGGFYGAYMHRLAQALERLEAVKPGELVGQMAQQNPDAFIRGVNRGMDRDPNAARGVGRRLGIR